MNKIPKELKREIMEYDKLCAVIGELQDIQGMIENQELISRLEVVINKLND